MIADGGDPPGMWMAPANLDATQCKMARAALGIGVPELAARAVVSPDTVFRLEKGERLHQRTIIAIREALGRAWSSLTRMAAGRVYGLSRSKRF
jgi:transcriptional regulator with XRE-family HTH domain